LIELPVWAALALAVLCLWAGAGVAWLVGGTRRK
jgi:hypothetical protein